MQFDNKQTTQKRRNQAIRRHMPTSQAIEVQQFDLWIDGRMILENVSTALPNQGLVVVLGPSGVGKSTWVRTLSGALRWLRTQRPKRRWRSSYGKGKVIVFGQETADWNPLQLRRTVAHVQQSPVMLPGSVADNLVRVQHLAGIQRTRNDQWMTARKAIKTVGLDKEVQFEMAASALSGGQAQRLSIARALLMDPRIVVLDEPTSALDDEAAATVVEVAQAVARQALVIMVTHDARLARLADRVLVFGRSEAAAGTLVMDAQPDDVFGTSAPDQVRNALTSIDRLINP